jgi:nitroreductase
MARLGPPLRPAKKPPAAAARQLRTIANENTSERLMVEVSVSPETALNGLIRRSILGRGPRWGIVAGIETWDALTSRRNVRAFADRSIDEKALARVLEAGRRAPSSRNWQPWDFVVVTDRDQLRELAKVWRGGGHVAESAATIALIVRESDDQRTRETAQFDLGQATMAIMVAAADQGIGSGHSAVEDQAKAREVLGLPEDRRVAYLIDLGFPADRPLRPIREPNRRPFDEVVHKGRW